MTIPWIKIGAAVVAFLAVFGGGVFTYNHIWNAGHTAGVNEQQVKIDALTASLQKAHDDAVTQKVTTDAVIKDLDAKAKLQLQNQNTQAQVQTKIITKVIHDNPTFATVVRPPDLDGVRTSQLEAIRDCCGTGQNGKAASPAGGSSQGLSGPYDSAVRIKPGSN